MKFENRRILRKQSCENDRDFMNACPLHQENEEKCVKADEIIGFDPFTVPGEGGMEICTDHESAEVFVKNDPMVPEGLVAKVTMKVWANEILQKVK